MTAVTHSSSGRAHFVYSGFTLLEILVAIAIFTIFSGLAYGGVVRLLEDRERLETENAFWRELSLAFSRMTDDLAQARTRSVRGVDGNALPAFTGQPTDIRALGGASVEFTRGGVRTYGGAVRSDLQRVAYQWKENTLWRLYWPVLDRGPVTEPLGAPLLGNVKEFTVRFYQDGGWIDRWPPLGVSGDQPPRAIEVRLLHATRGKFTRTFLVGSGE